ncbi:MAG TPA: hypothetical protein VL128_07045 [Candidatus Eisenbacteria bacterium]|nr:hypothetical protein [Candidatus Eisenbacteria bacterium]
MKKRMWFPVAILAFGLAVIGIASAQRPETDIDANHHPNLAEAQHHILQAYDKIEMARNAHRDQLGGHAEKAIEYLDKANHELKEAAEYANHHH